MSNYVDNLLRPGAFIYWKRGADSHGKTYSIVSLEDLSVNVENVETGAPDNFLFVELLNGDKGDSEPVFAATLETLQVAIANRNPPPPTLHPDSFSQALRDQATRIIEVVESVEQMVSKKESLALVQGEKFGRKNAIIAACAELKKPVSKSTFYDYRIIYNKNDGDKARIAASLRRGTFGTWRLSKAQLHFVDTILVKFHLGKRLVKLRPSTTFKLMLDILDRTKGMWPDPEECIEGVPANVVDEILNDKIPFSIIMENPEKRKILKPIKMLSRSRLYDYLRWFKAQPDNAEGVITERYGKELWRREFMIFDTFAAQAQFNLQYVFADHYCLKVPVIDERTRKIIQFLWLTVFFDVWSRSVLGIALMAKHPSITSIQLGLKHAVWPKVTHTELGIKGKWLPFGIPLELSLDNAWAHHSYSLERLSRAISRKGEFDPIRLAFRPPYRAHYGALIERFLGTLANEIREYLSPESLSNLVDRERDSIHDACLLYSDINYVIHRLIVKYQNTPHRELGGMTPNQKWVLGQNELGRRPVPQSTPELDRLFWHMYHQPRTITEKGICLFGFHYWSPELDTLPRVAKNQKHINYRVAYDLSNISQLAIFLGDDWLCDVEAQQLRLSDRSVAPLSHAEWILSKEISKAKGNSGVFDYLAFVNEMEEKLSGQPGKQGEKDKEPKKGKGRPKQTPRDIDKALEQASPTEGYAALLSEDW